MNPTAPAPLHGPWGQIQPWLTDGAPGAPRLLEQVSWSPVLSEQSFAPGAAELSELWATGGWVSWLGGPATAPLQTWPVDGDGVALAHVLSLHLGDLDGVLDAQGKAVWPGLREGLPTTGVLEVFHDLCTPGEDPGAGASGAWLVRWVSAAEPGALVDPPPVTAAPELVCQVVLPLPGFTLPPAVDAAGGPNEVFELAEELERQLRCSWQLQRTGRSTGEPAPVSHVYGHSQSGELNARAVLGRVLPLTEPSDEHRLLVDLEGWTSLAGWFGDAGHLEVWMRESDLRRRDFGAAWCLLRTG